MSRIGQDSVRLMIRGRPIVLKIPAKIRDDYDTEAILEEPDVDYNLEWAYGCPQAECLEFIYPTGELIYPVGAVIVMYNIESHSQRFYTGHTNLVTTLAIHPSATIVGKQLANILTCQDISKHV